MIDDIAARFPYWASGALIAVGLYGMIGKRSLVKKLIGMNIFQSAIILFFIAGSLREGATLPILFEGEGHAAGTVNP
ncbi:MAG: NADH-quinone oxidoreductase subunit K, partial [Chloroflexi bacterium]|nr:NADH-quinone oxidoreductase subunit K [Chloroflexota bacterium]